MLAEPFPDETAVAAEPAPRFAVHRIAIYTQSTINTGRKPQSSPVSSAWAGSMSACALKCFSNKVCKMFTFEENTCTIYAEEIDQVTFQNNVGTKVYYENK